MTGRAAARRYARALFDVVLRESDPRRVQQELQGFASLVAAHEPLQRVLANPGVPPAKKRAIVEQVLARAGAVSAPLRKLLVLLADRDRLALLSEIDRAFRDRLMEHLKVVRAEVTTAIPLAPERLRAIQDGLAAATGRQVQIDSRVNAALIGGAVARIGSTVFDGSVSRQLERMRETLQVAGE